MTNLKALITTLVLGSSTMASADSFSVSASAKVSLGFNTSSAPVIIRDHRAPAPAPVVVDPCSTTAAPVAVAYRPAQLPPVWSGPAYYNINNTKITPTSSDYKGWLANSPTLLQSTSYYGRVVVRPTHQATWFDLTEATRIDNGRERFMLGADNGWFSQLKLQNLGGRGSSISQVTVEFADNLGPKTQIVKLDQSLDARHPSITLDLDGNYRQIYRITVFGTTNRGAAYKILAM